jgi:hypothetical protein
MSPQVKWAMAGEFSSNGSISLLSVRLGDSAPQEESADDLPCLRGRAFAMLNVCGGLRLSRPRKENGDCGLGPIARR